MPHRCFINVKSPLTWDHGGQGRFLSAGRYEATFVDLGDSDKKKSKAVSWIIHGAPQPMAMSAMTFDTFTSIGAIERE
jgi:hypothetical protein